MTEASFEEDQWDDCWASDTGQIFTKEAMAEALKKSKASMALAEKEIIDKVTKASDVTVTISADTTGLPVSAGNLQDGLVGAWSADNVEIDLSDLGYVATPTPMYTVTTPIDWHMPSQVRTGNFSGNLAKLNWSSDPTSKRFKYTKDSKYRLEKRTVTDTRTVADRIYIEITAEYVVKDDMGEIKMPQLLSVMWWRSQPVTQKQIGRFDELRAKNSSNILSFLTDEDNSGELISSAFKPKRAYGAEFELFRRYYVSESHDSKTKKMLIIDDKEVRDYKVNPEGYTSYHHYSFQTGYDKYTTDLCLEWEKFLFGKTHIVHTHAFHWMKLEDMHIRTNNEVEMRMEHVKDKVGIYGIYPVASKRQWTVFGGGT